MVDWVKIGTQITEEHGEHLAAAQRLRHMLFCAIGSGDLAPGTRLTETSLVAELSVSRTPLREALAALKAENLLSVDEDGLRVRKLAWSDITSLYELRGHLEGLAARQTALFASPSEKAVIAQIATQEVTLMESAAPPHVLASQNARFHRVIWNSANNPFLLETMQQLSRLMVLLGATAYSLPERRDVIQNEHAAITKAISDSDGDAAEEAMQTHLHKALIARLAVLSASKAVELD